ncbi:hypothetical protein Pan153_49710 [Gimesia panareensis]|uniref:Uncharacterized protein n=1 Tax=Gimesia panareensis TaxID=2527978 RepID=A0A518FVF2_9PLAN|nr:hypothetical protein [Gimesia panareensis]QDV20296.1 hypothetical protein Pan153_49710 [Gimesia panareensis]
MVKFAISYQVHEHGWASVALSDGRTTIERPVSCLHDSLLDLARMALSLKAGHAESMARFLDEPGELQLVVIRDGHQAKYTVRWFSEESRGGMFSAEDGDILLEGTTTPVRIVQQITQVLWKIHEQIGVKEYRNRWQADFPLREYQQLSG